MHKLAPRAQKPGVRLHDARGVSSWKTRPRLIRGVCQRDNKGRRCSGVFTVDIESLSYNAFYVLGNVIATSENAEQALVLDVVWLTRPVLYQALHIFEQPVWTRYCGL